MRRVRYGRRMILEFERRDELSGQGGAYVMVVADFNLGGKCR